ncbi:MAG: hypothetical protein AAF633_27350, partial [Chloroflexota bacterium]
EGNVTLITLNIVVEGDLEARIDSNDSLSCMAINVIQTDSVSMACFAEGCVYGLPQLGTRAIPPGEKIIVSTDVESDVLLDLQPIEEDDVIPFTDIVNFPEGESVVEGCIADYLDLPEPTVEPTETPVEEPTNTRTFEPSATSTESPTVTPTNTRRSGSSSTRTPVPSNTPAPQIPATDTPAPPPPATNTPAPPPPATNTPAPPPPATNTPAPPPPATNTPAPPPPATNTPAPPPPATNTPAAAPPTNTPPPNFFPTSTPSS